MVLTLPDDLAARLRDIAQRENRTPEDVLKTMLNRYASVPMDESSDYYRVENVKKRLYERARRYWQQIGDQERLALTDEELEGQFWLFDQEGVPRLKIDQGTIDVLPNPLLAVAKAAEQLGLSSERSDISVRFKDVLRETWIEYDDKKRSSDAQ